MIVFPLADRLLLVNQIDHAAFAAELLSLWRSDGLPENPRRQALLRGTREHDNGWAEADSAPRRRPEGGPHEFRSIPGDLRLEIWNRGVERRAKNDPEAAVYVVRHALELHRGYQTADTTDAATAGSVDWDGTLARWQSLEGELCERLRLAEDDLSADYRFLFLADTLSLAACLRWSEPVECRGTTMRVEPVNDLRVDLHVEPFPLAGSTTFKMRCRIVPDRTFTSDTDLAMEMASARWQDLVVRLAA